MRTDPGIGRAMAVVPPWRDSKVRNVVWQVLLVVAIVAFGWWLTANAVDALDRRGMTSGVGFLDDSAGFALGSAFFEFPRGGTYLHAFAIGLGNTLVLSLVSIVSASILGAALGFARLSDNALINGAARAYILAFRNTPQLVQIVFWYTFFTLMPAPRQAWSIFGVAYASNRGLIVPAPENGAAFGMAMLALLAGIAVAFAIGRVDDRRRRAGRPWRHSGRAKALAIVGLPLLTWVVLGAPHAWSVPHPRGFNFQGGATLSPEFLAIYFGLSFYIAAFIAEIVRGGLVSVDSGQIEAARVIGLSRRDTYAKVIVPQALRVIVPPLAAQYISLLKNSSLGVAVGYPDLFSVANTSLTYSGRTIEVLCIMAAVYLLLSLAIGAAANLVNHLARIPER